MKLLFALALAAAPAAASPLPEIGDIMPVCRQSLAALVRGDREWLPRHLTEISASDDARNRFYTICAIHHQGAMDLISIEAEAQAPRT